MSHKLSLFLGALAVTGIIGAAAGLSFPSFKMTEAQAALAPLNHVYCFNGLTKGINDMTYRGWVCVPQPVQSVTN
jgi:hypothetical protein